MMKHTHHFDTWNRRCPTCGHSADEVAKLNRPTPTPKNAKPVDMDDVSIHGFNNDGDWT